MILDDFSGEWLSTYSYHSGMQTSRHVLQFTQQNNRITGTTVSSLDGSVVELSLVYDPLQSILSGRWHETTAVNGVYGGSEFYGSVQFIIGADDTAEGGWVGFGSDHVHINTGAWRLERG